MAQKQVRVLGISKVDQDKRIFLMLMDEVDGERKLPILMGQMEANSIIIALQNAGMRRPLIYDTTLNIMETCGIRMKRVVITERKDEIFYSEIVVESESGEMSVDSRTSDAVALAVRRNVPIMCEEELLEQAREEVTIRHTDDAPVGILFDDELGEMLQKAIAAENYERAQQIKKEMERRGLR